MSFLSKKEKVEINSKEELEIKIKLTVDDKGVYRKEISINGGNPMSVNGFTINFANQNELPYIYMESII